MLEDFTEKIITLYHEIYDILKTIAHKFDFNYPPITKDEVFKSSFE